MLKKKNNIYMLRQKGKTKKENNLQLSAQSSIWGSIVFCFCVLMSANLQLFSSHFTNHNQMKWCCIRHNDKQISHI